MGLVVASESVAEISLAAGGLPGVSEVGRIIAGCDEEQVGQEIIKPRPKYVTADLRIKSKIPDAAICS